MINTSDKTIISDFAEYNKKQGLVKLKNNIVAKDKNNNIIKLIMQNILIKIKY